ncbi:MAG: outer membrane protein assembly factor BamB family protein [Thermoguttaceae bacterium]
MRRCLRSGRPMLASAAKWFSFGGVGWFAGLVAIAAAAAQAEDWPMYQHDPARSGVSPQRLPLPLVESWVFQPRHVPEPAWGPPKAEPVEGILELPRFHFDDAPQVAVAAGRVYFGCSATGKVYCLDAATGRVRWTAMTGGPVRLAPTVSEGRVYVGSDDGYAYCLDAASGALVWQFRAAPEPKRVLGSRKMISLWPLRSGVLVDRGVAYLASGIFPAEGVFFYALDAQDGRLLWRNDTCGEAPQSGVSPQGYLLASETTLYAPMGRVSPAALDRRDGKLKYLTYFGKTVGGTYALLVDGEVYTGTEELVAYDGQSRDRFATYPGRKIIVSKDTVYLAGAARLAALDRLAYPAANNRVRSLRSRIAQLQKPPKGKSEPPLAAAAEIKSLATQLKAAEEQLARTVRWEVPCRLNEALILAGDVLVAGGSGRVQAVDSASGKTIWTANVDGCAKGLAAAGGRLLVSTDTGKIYCLAAQGSPQHGTVTEPIDPDPYKDSPLGPLFRQAAEAILARTAIRRGYCLVLGLETGQLCLELARRSELMIYAVSPDAPKVAAARKALDAAGLYGSRVCVDQFPLDQVPYADYFANLIVSETGLLTGNWPLESGSDWQRMLKPLGGTAVLDLGPATPGTPAPSEGSVRLIVRGALPGAGSWTHQYGNPANTGSGDDEVLRCPLEVLWFGEPGPGTMVNRHLHAAAPLVIDGRVFVQGENVLMAYDAYNGLKLWERAMPGAIRTNVTRDVSNLAAGPQGLFVAVDDHCLRLDPETGKTAHRYDLPRAADGKPRRWAYVASTEKLLYGSRSPAVPGLAKQPWSAVTTSDCLFAVDPESGSHIWAYQGNQIPHNSIAIAQGKVFLVDRDLTAPQRQQVVDRARQEILKLPEAERPRAEQELAKADIRCVIALDARTGQVLWRQAVDLSDCGEGALSAMAHDGVLLLFGVWTDGHFWKEFFAGQFARRRIVALSADDGSILWSKPVGYRVRPLVIGQTLHAEPWAFALRTGEPQMRAHPVTGQPDRWQFARPGHHCGCPIGSPHCLFFRSWCLGYYDLDNDSGTMHFGAQRPGCWINFIPAGGLLVMPEASAGCMCAFPNMCTVVLKPGRSNHGYAYFSAPGPLVPVQRLGINFGAPGDRKDSAGKLWLGYPRPKGPLVLDLKLDVSLLPGGGYLQANSRYAQVAGTQEGWLFASAVAGLKQCVIPLLGKGDPPARYRVRLAFADPDNTQPGQRVFGIKLQDKPVLDSFDIVKEAGGPNRAVFKEFSGIEVKDDLTVQLVPKTPNPSPQQGPILQAIEITRQ